MKRRKALKNIGLGLTAGITLPWLGSCKPDDPQPEIDYDGTVAIIGAGAAGLYAADILRTKGITVKLFEASDRIGGRIRSIRLFDDSPVVNDFPIELGAERVIGTDSIWSKIIDQSKVPVVDLTAKSVDQYIVDNVSKPSADLQADGDFIAAQEFYKTLKSRSGSNMSVQQAIASSGINSRVHAILNSWIANKRNTVNDRLGLLAYTEELNVQVRNNDERLLGSNPMTDVLASRFNNVMAHIQLDSVVKTIDYSGVKIKITGQTKSGEPFTAEVDKVIVTVPVSILKAGSNAEI